MPAEPGDPLRRVVLAISTFRDDAAALAMLHGLFAAGSGPFRAVVVVDSLGSGAIATEIAARRWPVRLHDADRNLGAAGNHAKRMEMAAAVDGAAWCFAVNADGELDLDAVRALVRCGERGERIGAVYPARRRPNRGDSWEPPRSSFLPLSPPLAFRPPDGGDREVLWSSSNGALYHLRPARDGLRVWADLWHGWEDLAYAWLLHRHGWRQLLCADAVFVDRYQHRPARLLGRTIYLHDKRPWISYYTVRNLLLFVRRTDGGPRGWAVAGWRYLQECLLAALFKDRKLRRIGFLTRGLVDGLRGRTGMVVAPELDG